jgi:hypothetical protein
MISLIRMRLTGFARTGRALAPLIGALVVLTTIYGGGQAQAGEAYGFSAAVLFPVLAWQTKLLLDTEPDTQRRLAAVALGSRRREWLAGLVAAALAGVGVTVLALIVPWLVGGVTGPQRPDDPSLSIGFGVGIWAHLVLLPAAVILGALASRAVTGNAARGVAVLVSGAVLSFVLGIPSSPLRWAVAPVIAVGRATTHGLSSAVPGYTVQALLWAAAGLAGYGWLRRNRA